MPSVYLTGHWGETLRRRLSRAGSSGYMSFGPMQARQVITYETNIFKALNVYLVFPKKLINTLCADSYRYQRSGTQLGVHGTRWLASSGMYNAPAHCSYGGGLRL